MLLIANYIALGCFQYDCLRVETLSWFSFLFIYLRFLLPAIQFQIGHLEYAKWEFIVVLASQDLVGFRTKDTVTVFNAILVVKVTMGSTHTWELLGYKGSVLVLECNCSTHVHVHLWSLGLRELLLTFLQCYLCCECESN